jgi:vacuolar-type H+-ATPase subunit H
VPDDRTAPERELASVFLDLEPVQTECHAIRVAAARDADHATTRARRRADAVLADARSAAVTERANALAESRARGDAEQAAIIADAEQRAARIRERAAERMPALVAEAVELVRKELR